MKTNTADPMLDILHRLAKGISKADLDKVRHVIVAPGLTIHDYIGELKSSGAIEWDDNGKLRLRKNGVPDARISFT